MEFRSSTESREQDGQVTMLTVFSNMPQVRVGQNKFWRTSLPSYCRCAWPLIITQAVVLNKYFFAKDL